MKYLFLVNKAPKEPQLLENKKYSVPEYISFPNFISRIVIRNYTNNFLQHGICKSLIIVNEKK